MNPWPRIRRYGGLGSARALLGLVSALLILPQVAQAQPRPVHPDGPRLFAITGARIVTVSGGVIDHGTIVVNNGVIQSVGANVQVPSGAWVIDGSGKTVYPGLVDAFTDLGHPYTPPQRSFGFGGGRGGPPVSSADFSWGPEDRPGTKSWLSAADDIDAGDARLERWRNAGFTTVLSTLQPGLVPGQAAVLDLGEFHRPREMVVATPVGMRVNLFDRSYSGYPQSLLGSFAYLKQLYLDADHYAKVWDDYDANPRGKARPEWDRTLEPIRQEQKQGWPLLFPAADRKEIGRAIATSKVMGVRPIVYGAQGAYEAADVLAKAGVPALVDVDWPTAPRGADPDQEPTLETLRLRDHAPTTPAALQKAGVKFAFYSGSLSNPGEMLAKARESIALGLSKDAAIRAFTLSPAEIFGVADRTGSIEAGKIANLIIASGDIFEDGTHVERVIVDGNPYEVPAPGDEMAMAGGNGRRGSGGRGGQGRGGAAASTAPEQVPMAQDKGPYRDDAVTLLKNATIMTASHGNIENGSILIENGKIAAVGTNVSAPSGAYVVDLSGKWVIPGIVDCHSHIAADAINEGAVNVSAMVGIKDVLNPNDPNIYWAVAGGVTSINVLHGSANPIGGGNAVIKLRWGSDAQDLLLQGAPLGIKFALGENVTRDRNPPRYPGTRLGQQDVIRQAFLDAKVYKKKWDDWEAGGRKGIPPRQDLKLEKLKQILEGTRYVHSHAYRADEMLQLMEVADEMGFKIRTFQHGLEGYKIADEIAAHGTGVSTFSDWWAYKVEAYDAIPYNAALMTQRGVLVSINSDSGEEMRHLNQEAAKTMKWGGLDEQEALREVTLNSAKQLGIDKWVGSIDVGKDADLAVFDGYPLDMLGKVIQTYIDGKLYFDRGMDKVRQAAIAKEKAALMEQVGGSQAGSRNASDRIAPRAGEEVMR